MVAGLAHVEIFHHVFPPDPMLGTIKINSSRIVPKSVCYLIQDLKSWARVRLWREPPVAINLRRFFSCSMGRVFYPASGIGEEKCICKLSGLFWMRLTFKHGLNKWNPNSVAWSLPRNHLDQSLHRECSLSPIANSIRRLSNRSRWDSSCLGLILSFWICLMLPLVVRVTD